MFLGKKNVFNNNRKFVFNNNCLKIYLFTKNCSKN